MALCCTLDTRPHDPVQPRAFSRQPAPVTYWGSGQMANLPVGKTCDALMDACDWAAVLVWRRCTGRYAAMLRPPAASDRATKHSQG